MGGPEDPEGTREDADAQIRTFLIADVRGYTLFTHERGDEAAGKLAARFAEIAREAVEARAGVVLELRGDEALCVFSSARQAMRAAVDLQDRFVEATVDEPSLPLTVGIGLDAGEAVPVEGGYRGGALNLAARLCGQAKAGEILASREVSHLARRIDGIAYEDRGALALKGLATPVDVVRVTNAEADAAERLRAFAPAAPGRRRTRRTTWIVAAAAVVAIAIAAVSIPVLTDKGEPVRVETNSLARIDPVDGAVLGSVPLEGRPGATATDGETVWVAQPDRDQIVKVDVESGSIDDLVAVDGTPSAVALGLSSLWFTDADAGTVSRISPEDSSVTETIDAGTGPVGIAVGGDHVWVADAIGNHLLRITPATDEIQTVSLAAGPSGVAVAESGVWVSSSEAATVSRVDPDTLEVQLEASVGNEPTAVLAAFGSIWVTNHVDGTISRIDPRSGSILATIPVGDGPDAIAATDDRVWVANEYDGALTAIDPGINQVADSIDLGATLAAVTAVGGELWVSVGVAADAHRGGTLRIAAFTAPITLDPGVSYDVITWSVLSVTNDGLLAYKKTAGVDGGTIVPDLATSLPSVSEDGLTYRFALRDGLRFSTGDPVRPEDVRYSFERALAISSDAATLLAAIDGAPACNRDPETCDLSASIEIEPGVVTIHLSRADPDFVYKLALPFAFVVPEGTPMEDQLFEPVPATGPYMVDRAGAEQWILVRNPLFEPWSEAAQPDGFVDRIEWTFDVRPSAAAERLVSGQLDFAPNSLPPDALAELEAAHPQQVIRVPSLLTFFMGMNLNEPPFDDPDVRRALNYAVDRGAVAPLFEPDLGVPTCQILPPNLPGYEPYCPYTVDPGTTWTAPDLDRARELIAASGAAGTDVEVWTPDTPDRPAALELGQYFVELLDDLGFEAELHAVRDFDRYVEQVYLGGSDPPLYSSGWAADFPAPGGFIDVQFRCGVPGNIAQLCDPELDREIDEAQALQVSDPAAANALWAEIDRRLVDDAVWVPLANLLNAYPVSERLENVQINPQWGLLLSRVWVQ
jgi:peptide/nickel transport system substrate-binding protein